MNFDPILSKRLRLRKMTKDDLAFVIGIWGDPVIGQYLTDPDVEHMDGEYLELLKSIPDSDDGVYLVAESFESGHRIGTCSFFYDEGTSTCDLGYTIHPYFWKQGYGSEMVQAVIDYARDCLGSKRITAPIFKDNPGSNALIRKLGFTVFSEGFGKKSGTDKVMEEYIYELKL